MERTLQDIRRMELSAQSPISQEDLSLSATMNGLEPQLFARIKGQDMSFPASLGIERDQLGLPPAAKPLGSLLVLGPTGVGKTASALEFFAFPFRRNSLFRFDMSEAPSLNRNQPHCLPDWPLDPMPKLPRMTPSLFCPGITVNYRNECRPVHLTRSWSARREKLITRKISKRCFQ